jgi:DNA-binding CsgD family transcriptional regulator
MGIDSERQLTRRERDCLELVAQGLSSKEIAAKLGIAPGTVDNHLKRAVKALGASNRRVAARLIDPPPDMPAEPVQSLDSQALDIAPPPAGMVKPQPDRMHSDRSFRFPMLRQGRRHNDLSIPSRALWIVATAILLLFALANFFVGLGALHSIAG